MNFEKAIQFVLSSEGDYVNDPGDPGGETKYGISKRAYPKLDIKNLSRKQAVEIYKKDYWVKSEAFDITEKLRLAYFDTAVNCGIIAAKEFLTRSGGTLEGYLLHRTFYYNSIVNSKTKKFLHGWLNRVKDLYAYELTGG